MSETMDRIEEIVEKCKVEIYVGGRDEDVENLNEDMFEDEHWDHADYWIFG